MHTGVKHRPLHLVYIPCSTDLTQDSDAGRAGAEPSPACAYQTRGPQHYTAISHYVSWLFIATPLMSGAAKRNWSSTKELWTNAGGCPPTRHQQAKLIDDDGCDLVRSWKVSIQYDMRAFECYVTNLPTMIRSHPNMISPRAPMCQRTEYKTQESLMKLFVSSVVGLSTSDL
jgi:hypothetical protein